MPKPKAVAAPQKSFTISFDSTPEGKRTTSITANGEVEPQEMFDGLINGLSALYINVWGQEQRVRPPLAEESDDDLTPEQFCQLVVKKILARLTGWKVEQSTVQ